jgi:hypothetical protein
MYKLSFSSERWSRFKENNWLEVQEETAQGKNECLPEQDTGKKHTTAGIR